VSLPGAPVTPSTAIKASGGRRHYFL
jgi:hypothetical protein